MKTHYGSSVWKTKLLKATIGITLFCLIGSAAAGSAADLSFKLLILNGLMGPLTGPPDTEFSLFGSMLNPVYLIVDDVPQSVPIGQAWYASLIDPAPPAGLEGPAEVIFIDIRGFHIYAAGVETRAGRLATVSASDAASTLSGTWQLEDAVTAGIAGGTADDAVVTFLVDFNAGPPTVTARLEMGLIGIVPLLNAPVEVIAREPGGTSAQLRLAREVDVRLIVDDAMRPPAGKLTSYSVRLVGESGFSLKLSVFLFGGIPVLAVQGSSEDISISCGVSGGGVLSRLSGDCNFLGGRFRVGVIPGITEDDQIWRADLSLP